VLLDRVVAPEHAQPTRPQRRQPLLVRGVRRVALREVRAVEVVCEVPDPKRGAVRVDLDQVVLGVAEPQQPLLDVGLPAGPGLRLEPVRRRDQDRRGVGRLVRPGGRRPQLDVHRGWRRRPRRHRHDQVDREPEHPEQPLEPVQPADGLVEVDELDRRLQQVVRDLLPVDLVEHLGLQEVQLVRPQGAEGLCVVELVLDLIDGHVLGPPRLERQPVEPLQ
jgi:hypothetical protein